MDALVRMVAGHYQFEAMREDLYEQVWREPRLRVAERYGVKFPGQGVHIDERAAAALRPLGNARIRQGRTSATLARRAPRRQARLNLTLTLQASSAAQGASPIGGH